MNFVEKLLSIKCKSKTLFISILFSLLCTSIYIVGCGDRVRLPSTSQLTEFEDAGPLKLTIDESSLMSAKISGAPYRVVSNEVLELTMPSILQVITTEESIDTTTTAPYICRISENGTITLPVIGEIEVVGKTLAQIESLVIEAYYPEYTVTRPSVFARVLEYDMAKVSISGAVQNPGVYSLRRDQMSLVALLMEAGGIVEEGAALIKIIHIDDEVVLSDENKNKKIISENAVQQPSGPIDSRLAKLAASYPEFDDIEVKMTYQLLEAVGKKGMLYVTYDKIILLKEQLDVTSEIERLASLEMLAKKEPWIPIAHIDQKLCELAELLEPGSGRRKSEINIPYLNDGNRFQSKFKIKKTNDWIFHGQSRKQVPQFSTADMNYRSDMSGLNRSGYGVLSAQQRTTRRINSEVEFKTSFTMQRYFPAQSENQGVSQPFDQIQNAVTVKPAGTNRKRSSESLVLPIKGLNIPFSDVELRDGDSIIVERLQMPLFTVVGLVLKPGNFEYPPDVQYNLIQAIAFAGGLDQIPEPRYVTIYRLKSDGQIVSAFFNLVNTKQGPGLMDSFNIQIKPGDIISVEHTPRTRTNVFLKNVFRINIGTYFQMNDIWAE